MRNRTRTGAQFTGDPSFQEKLMLLAYVYLEFFLNGMFFLSAFHKNLNSFDYDSFLLCVVPAVCKGPACCKAYSSLCHLSVYHPTWGRCRENIWSVCGCSGGQLLFKGGYGQTTFTALQCCALRVGCWGQGETNNKFAKKCSFLGNELDWNILCFL